MPTPTSTSIPAPMSMPTPSPTPSPSPRPSPRPNPMAISSLITVPTPTPMPSPSSTHTLAPPPIRSPVPTPTPAPARIPGPGPTWLPAPMLTPAPSSASSTSGFRFEFSPPPPSASYPFMPVSTFTPTSSSKLASTSTPSSTSSPASTSKPSSIPAPKPAHTLTPMPAPTSLPTSTPTSTPTLTITSAPTSTPTSTFMPVLTSNPAPIFMHIFTSTPTPTSTPAPTSMPTPISMPVPVPASPALPIRAPTPDPAPTPASHPRPSSPQYGFTNPTATATTASQPRPSNPQHGFKVAPTADPEPDTASPPTYISGPICAQCGQPAHAAHYANQHTANDNPHEIHAKPGQKPHVYVGQPTRLCDESNPLNANEYLPLPAGWLKLTHLGGAVYFFNPHTRVVTPADVREALVERRVAEEYTRLCAEVGDAKVARELRRDLVMVIELPGVDAGGGEKGKGKEKEVEVEAYYVCIDRMAVFKLKGDQVEYGSKERLWAHIERYPMHWLNFPVALEVEFLNALTFGASERFRDARNTPFPFSGETCERLMRIYQDSRLRHEEDAHTLTPLLIWEIARAMRIVEASRGRYGYGTPSNRLYRNLAAPPPAWWEGALLGAPLLGAHHMYKRRLQESRVKGEVYAPVFQRAVQGFLDEWADSNLLATVFAGASVAFLAVPNVTPLQQTASLASTIFAVTSIVTGLHHVWRHRPKTSADRAEAARYLNRAGAATHAAHDADLAVTAAFLAVPLAALLWSVLAFTVAIAAFCVQGPSAGSDSSSGGGGGGSGGLDLGGGPGGPGKIGTILLLALLGVLTLGALLVLAFFAHVWRAPRDEEIEDGFDLIAGMAYQHDHRAPVGWRDSTRDWVLHAPGALRRRLRKVKGAMERSVLLRLHRHRMRKARARTLVPEMAVPPPREDGAVAQAAGMAAAAAHAPLSGTRSAVPPRGTVAGAIQLANMTVAAPLRSHTLLKK
ncbi:hypothetical protein CONPUDRAFT_146885 [Coniophora puteana RWD-64-598 SS2]|uniref:WW domain-containing protein n=1 Tax=Coniophora puteana (strain RWD-64-598) TaxID=741705 RepID=A0A5M3MC61_CONPW|nr:uncharacterized protein CONPUDRAFT_146885 [Coniophora puteana RWD-64-598 SS2]EIW76494.1 hypothetical protein CONPUDRAFT_146885 [Coniophora puteana RWD-64-598 SS2]